MTNFSRAYWRLDDWLAREFLGTIAWLGRIWRALWAPVNNPSGRHWSDQLTQPLSVPHLLAALALERAEPWPNYTVQRDGGALILFGVDQSTPSFTVELDPDDSVARARDRFRAFVAVADVAAIDNRHPRRPRVREWASFSRTRTDTREATPARLPERPRGAHRLGRSPDNATVATRELVLTAVQERRADRIVNECLMRSPDYRLRMGI